MSQLAFCPLPAPLRLNSDSATGTSSFSKATPVNSARPFTPEPSRRVTPKHDRLKESAPPFKHARADRSTSVRGGKGRVISISFGINGTATGKSLDNTFQQERLAEQEQDTGPNGPAFTSPHSALLQPEFSFLQDPAASLSKADLELFELLATEDGREESSPKPVAPLISTTGSSTPSFIQHLRNVVLDQSTLERLIARYPGLNDHAHRGLLLHSLFSASIHASTDRGGTTHKYVRIGYATLAGLEGQSKKASHNHYRGLDFLKAHESVMPRFDFTEYFHDSSGAESHPRLVNHHGLSQEDMGLLTKDLLRPVDGLEAPIYGWSQDACPAFDNGHAAQRVKAWRDRLTQMAKKATRNAVCDLQHCLLNYMNGQSSNRYARLIRRNIEHALQAAATLDDEGDRLRRLQHLRQIQIQPKPFYQPSKKKRTVRIFPLNDHFVGLPKDIRRALTRGCLECDLTNAQLAIASAAWDVPLLNECLVDTDERSRPAWPRLFAAAGLDHGVLVETDEYGPLKAALKTAIYAILFGMSERGVRWVLGRTLRLSEYATPWKAAGRFLSDPLLQELFSARQMQLDRIVAAGGATDCFGTWYPVEQVDVDASTPEEGARSVLASIMQAWELRLLEGIIRDACNEHDKKRPKYRILAWQHDGFTVDIDKDRRGSIERRLVKLVGQTAAEFGIPTALETEWL